MKMNQLLKTCPAFLYRFLTDYGPIPRYPFLFWPFRRYLGCHVARLWRKDVPLGLPDARTELIIASPGHCASHALLKYITQYNPDRNILLGPHAPAPIVYAVRHGIPCVILTKDFLAYMKSSYHSSNPTAGHNPMLFYKRILPVLEELLVVRFEDLIKEPKEIVEKINQRFSLDLNTGDNVLPRVRTYVSSKTTED